MTSSSLTTSSSRLGVFSYLCLSLPCKNCPTDSWFSSTAAFSPSARWFSPLRLYGSICRAPPLQDSSPARPHSFCCVPPLLWVCGHASHLCQRAPFDVD